MITIALLTLLGAGLAVFALDSEGDDSGDETTNADCQEAGNNPGQSNQEDAENLILNYIGEATITGGEGDDSLQPAGDTPEDSGLASQTELVDLRGGDDHAEIAGYGSTTINGGEGDDTLVSHGVGNTLNGMSGDDTLAAGSADTIFGGEGDDVLTYEATELNDTTALVHGGKGEDHIVISETLGLAPQEEDSDIGGARYMGGKGEDLFDLTLHLGEYDSDNQDTPETVDEGTFLNLRDFNHAEDRLVIDIQQPDGAAERELTSTELIQGSISQGGNDYNYTDLVMNFAANENEPAITSAIRFAGHTVTMDDIAFVQSA